MKRNYKCGMLVFVCAFALLMAGCGAEKREDLSLKVGLMPAVDAAPILLAEQNGYFTDLGLTVELQMFAMRRTGRARCKRRRLTARLPI